jgi:uncharacterized protein (TIGR02453 family)
VSRFSGIPVEAFDFYEQLSADNTRSWWQGHKPDYESYVKQPLLALTAELAGEFGEAHLFRPYRDVRFAKDKSPLKDHQGAYVGLEDAIGYYLQVSATGLMVAGGWYAPQGQQVAEFRKAIDSGQAGYVRGLIKKLEKQGWEIDGQPLKTRPKGVAVDHPDLDLLRFRALTASKTYPVEAWMGTRKTLTRVRKDWRQLQLLTEWLADHVGPATDPALESQD